jgi:predicted nicotinamide N-methyase
MEAGDIDAFAIEAITLNAAVNGVAITRRCADLVGADEGWDAVLAGDIFYERDIAERVTGWLSLSPAAAPRSSSATPVGAICRRIGSSALPNARCR